MISIVILLQITTHQAKDTQIWKIHLRDAFLEAANWNTQCDAQLLMAALLVRKLFETFKQWPFISLCNSFFHAFTRNLLYYLLYQSKLNVLEKIHTHTISFSLFMHQKVFDCFYLDIYKRYKDILLTNIEA
jgi:hypothetical protein